MSSPGKWQDYDDIFAAARKRMPHGFFAYMDHGCGEDLALTNNRESLRKIRLRSRVLRDVSARTTATTLFGISQSMPVVIAPTGPAGMVWLDGEVALARAAADAGIPFTVSTAATTPLEVIRRSGGGRQWFQLYMWPDREQSYEVVARAAHAGYDALVVTVDSMVPRNRPIEARSGFVPFQWRPRNLLDVIMHPRWMFGSPIRQLLSGGMVRYENFPGFEKAKVTQLPRVMKNDTVTWTDLEHLRERWRGTLIVKGITHPADAEKAVACGVDGIVISNHGGVVLDAAPAPIDLLPGIAQAVGGKTTILIDSGFRRGIDVVKALALGADAVMLGRMPLYALAAAGQVGASRALEILQQEILHTLAMTGCINPDEVGHDILWRDDAAT
nr:alpha-hydroxy acid oxidase [Pseudomonas caspiana]